MSRSRGSKDNVWSFQCRRSNRGCAGGGALVGGAPLQPAPPS